MERNSTVTTSELALRFGKSETYILQRLKLNDLIPEAKKDFYNNNMSIGHALLLARLTPNDQRDSIKRVTDSSNGYGTIAQLQNFINREIVNDLSAAPFNPDDAELIKKAGPCSLCPKRTGTSPLLFADIKEKDRCIDRGCFAAKCNAFLIGKTKETIETKPEIVFLADYSDPIPQVVELLDEHKIKPLKEYSDFNTHTKSGKKVKGLWLSGNRAGFTDAVYLRVKETDTKKGSDEKSVIEGIQARIKRARELDAEKVYAKIIEALKKHPTQKKECKKLQPDEEVFLWYMVLDKASYHLKLTLKKIMGIVKDEPAKLYQALKNLKAEKKALILRKVVLDQYSGIQPTSDFAYIIRKIAEGYRDIDISTFEKEQKEIQLKRENNAKERIKLLQQK